MSGNVCHIEEVGFTFGSGHEHLMTANRAIIVRDCFGIKIKWTTEALPPSTAGTSTAGLWWVAATMREARAGLVGAIGSPWRTVGYGLISSRK